MAQRKVKRLSASVAAFLRDDRGSYTIWSLVWFILYCAIGGLAVDVTDAYRNQALLQSTADAAALAGVMSLPNEADSVTEAAFYAADNMAPSHNGIVLKASDIEIGTWDFAARSFAAGGIAPNAVRAVTRRAEVNSNPVAMAVLRIIALFGWDPRWNIATEAVAVRYVPSCANDGLIALNSVDLSSNNDLLKDICVHGQNAGVDMENGNYFEPGVRVSMPYLGMLPDRSNLFPMNPGLEDALAEGDMWPRDVDLLNDYIDALRNLDAGYNAHWDFMYRPDGNGGHVMPTKVTGSSLPGTLAPYTVYDISCSGQVKLPKNEPVWKVVIVTDCRVQAASDFSAGDVVIASTSTGPNASIDLAAQSDLGLPDDCAPGGGIELYTMGNIHVSAQGSWNGLRIVAGNDVKFTANNAAVHGISVQAGNDIDFTSNNQFGLCAGGVPGPFALQFRLTR